MGLILRAGACAGVADAEVADVRALAGMLFAAASSAFLSFANAAVLLLITSYTLLYKHYTQV